MADRCLYFLFSIHRSLYAIDALAVNVTFSLPAITPVEEAPSFIAGVINLHEKIIPVIDLNPLFGRNSQELSVSDAVLVMQHNDGLVGLIVNEVCDVIEIDAAQIDHPTRSEENNFVLGMARVGEQIISILDYKKIVSLDDDFVSGAAGVHGSEVSEIIDVAKDAVFKNRAIDLMKKVDIATENECIQVAVVLLGQEYFGMDIRYINEFSKVKNITPLPNCPQHVLGNMNLRGSILTVIDIRNALGMHESEFNLDAKIVVSSSADILVGVAVDDVDEIIQLKQDDVVPLPVSTSVELLRFSVGTAAFNDRAMTILNLPEILKSKELVVN